MLALARPHLAAEHPIGPGRVAENDRQKQQCPEKQEQLRRRDEAASWKPWSGGTANGHMLISNPAYQATNSRSKPSLTSSRPRSSCTPAHQLTTINTRPRPTMMWKLVNTVLNGPPLLPPISGAQQ